MEHIVLVWAIVSTILLVVICYLHFVSNPLPFPDRGHCCYGVRDEKAQVLLVTLFSELGIITELFTMDAGPSHQTIMSDGRTVVHYLEQTMRGNLFTGTALSVRSSDPYSLVCRIVATLKQSGYSAIFYQPALGDLPQNSFFVITSNAFLGWELVVTQPILKMPMPLKRKILH